MTIKFFVSKRTLPAVGVLVAIILIGSVVTPAQEQYEGRAGVSEKTITAVISWQTDFVTTPDENKQPATNPCWPFSISVSSAPGAHTAFGATSAQSRYKLKEDLHTCTFDVTAPAGLPLVIVPAVRLHTSAWLNAKPMPPDKTLGGIRFRFKRGFSPPRREWTLGAKGVYLRFTFGFVPGSPLEGLKNLE